MVEVQKPFLLRVYDDGQDILITFDFHNRAEVAVYIDDADASVRLTDSLDYDIIYKFGRGYVTLHISDDYEVTPETSVIVVRETPQDQACSITSGRTAPRPNLELQLDRIVMMVQDMSFENRNALRLPVGDPADAVLPLIEDRVDSVFAFAEDVNSSVTYAVYPSGQLPISSYMQELLSAETTVEYRSKLSLWDISYKSISNVQEVINAIPDFETIPIFTPFAIPE